MTVSVSVFRNMSEMDKGAFEVPEHSIDVSRIKVIVLDQIDKSDPLDQLLVVGFKIGQQRFGARAAVKRHEYPKTLEAAIAALLIVAAEHGAEIRDAIAQECAGGKT